MLKIRPALLIILQGGGGRAVISLHVPRSLSEDQICVSRDMHPGTAGTHRAIALKIKKGDKMMGAGGLDSLP